MHDLKHKTAAITGAASGIGRETALLLADEGCRLALSDVDEAGLKEIAEILAHKGPGVSTHIVDVADRASMKRFAEEAENHHGGVDIVINNAGVTVFDTIKDGKVEDFEWLMGINLWGVYYGCKYFLPYLSKAKEAAIVNISSIFGFAGIPSQTYYCTSKFAVRGMTEALRLELAVSDPHIHVCCVHPGTIDTNIVHNGRFLGKTMLGETKKELADNFHNLAMTKPSRAARAIVRGIKKKSKRVRIGIDSKLIDFLARMLPVRYPALVLPLLRRTP